MSCDCEQLEVQCDPCSTCNECACNCTCETPPYLETGCPDVLPTDCITWTGGDYTVFNIHNGDTITSILQKILNFLSDGDDYTTIDITDPTILNMICAYCSGTPITTTTTAAPISTTTTIGITTTSTSTTTTTEAPTTTTTTGYVPVTTTTTEVPTTTTSTTLLTCPDITGIVGSGFSGVPFNDTTTTTSTSTIAPTTTTTTVAPLTCTAYINNTGGDLNNINYIDCDGVQHNNETIDDGQSVCMQDGTGNGGDFASLTIVGPC